MDRVQRNIMIQAYATVTGIMRRAAARPTSELSVLRKFLRNDSPEGR
ncbi:hypothetical protein CIHG_05626 [Coccidioides immitis H538.4]|uniref:Uncharacterized protein n=3 Tax=Coccidioides immitis TaxID=5501 RepID=A0A0J8TXM5_COCIT|nr:hypothetical protein CIRG_08408 [Coccidioides immitis RMSCC 2394]KMU78717.1 hypothetical protein CISG_01757 [Coccidioides immitis RMSCC 3703]KMU87859.1 hypothetical protein CIHG_05626 [Coccidioides immitis H538.4]